MLKMLLLIILLLYPFTSYSQETISFGKVEIKLGQTKETVLQALLEEGYRLEFQGGAEIEMWMIEKKELIFNDIEENGFLDFKNNSLVSISKVYAGFSSKTAYGLPPKIRTRFQGSMICLGVTGTTRCSNSHGVM